MFDINKSYTEDELNALLKDTKNTKKGADLALKDATLLLYYGPKAKTHVDRAADNLRNLRRVNLDKTPLEVQEDNHLPYGSMLYFAGDKLFAFSIEFQDVANSIGDPMLMGLVEHTDEQGRILYKPKG